MSNKRKQNMKSSLGLGKQDDKEVKKTQDCREQLRSTGNGKKSIKIINQLQKYGLPYVSDLRNKYFSDHKEGRNLYIFSYSLDTSSLFTNLKTADLHFSDLELQEKNLVTPVNLNVMFGGIKSRTF